MMDPKAPKEHAFVIMQVGAKETIERRRADEVFTYVIKPVVEARGLEARRADLDVSPGSITQKLLKDLVEARIVIADLTGRNPNVYYELGIAHSFAKPLIAVADSASGLPFDNKDERVLELGEYPESGLPVARVEAAKKTINDALDVALADGYDAPTPLKEVAGARSLDALAPSDPVAAELAQMRELLENLRSHTAPRRVFTPSMTENMKALQQFVQDCVRDGAIGVSELETLITLETSPAFDIWVRELQESVRAADDAPVQLAWDDRPVANPWTAVKPADEPPF